MAPPDLPPDLADAIMTMATELLRDVDQAILDNDADTAVLSGATLLAPSFLRDGYFRLHRAVLRALEARLGRQWVADYLEALAGMYAEPLEEVLAAEDAAREERAWDAFRAQIRPSRRQKPLSRQEIEEAVGN